MPPAWSRRGLWRLRSKFGDQPQDLGSLVWLSVHWYGFVAVFVTALTLRSAHRNHEFQRDMQDITVQVERGLPPWNWSIRG